MKNKILNFLNIHKKYLITVSAYLIIILTIWEIRDNFLYSHIPSMIRKVQYTHTILDIVILSLAFAGLICLVRLVRCPIHISKRVDKVVRQIGLHNDLKEYPTLISAHADYEKEHGQIYTLKNIGLSPVDYDNKVYRLQTSLKGHIYNIEEDKHSRTCLSILPRKYVKPTIISPNDEAIGSMSIHNLINALVVGATGTGKTVCIKLIISKILQHRPNSNIWVLDFKGQDFKFLKEYARYYRGLDECIKGLYDYHKSFQLDQERGTVDCSNYIVVDEWAALLRAIEIKNKKLLGTIKAIMSDLIMVGRGYQYYPILGMQRADSEYFATARDNFELCIGLGNLSQEGKKMLFTDFRDDMPRVKKREGYMLVSDQENIERIKIAEVDVKALDENIGKAMH